MKKFITLTLFISISFCALAAGEDATQQLEAQNKLNEKQGVYVETSEDQNPLQRLVENNPLIQGRFKTCEGIRALEAKRDSSILETFDMGKCLWEGRGNLQALTPDQKSKIIAELEIQQDDGSTTGSPKYESLDISTTKSTSDKTIKKLQDFLFQRLQKLMFEDNDDKESHKVAQNHQIFHRLYNSQLGRNVINVMSDFCLQTKVIDKVYKSNKTKKCETVTVLKYISGDAQKKKNIQGLPNDLKAVAADPNANVGFNNCIAQIANACGNLEHWAPKAGEFFDDAKECGDPNKTGDDIATVTNSDTGPQACLVTKHIKTTKQAMTQMAGINKAWKRLEDKNTQSGKQRFDGAVSKQKASDKFKVDDVINVGSGEIKAAKVDDESLSDTTASETAFLKKCETNYAANKEACDKYLMKEEDNLKLQGEFSLRKHAMAEKIRMDLEKDPNNAKLKSILEEKGMNEAKINAILSDKAKAEEAKKKITNQYAAERDNLVKAMRDRFNERTTFADKNKTPEQVAQEKFASLKDKSEKRHQNYTDAVYYSNVVSSLIAVKTGSGTSAKIQGRNTRALAAELANSAYDPSGRAPGSSAPGGNQSAPNVDFGQLKGVGDGYVKSQGLKDKDLDGSSLGSDQLSGMILQYLDPDNL